MHIIYYIYAYQVLLLASSRCSSWNILPDTASADYHAPSFPFIVDDAPERLSDQAGPSDQAAIDLWLRHELVDGIGSHRTSVLDANGLGHLLVVKTRQDRAEEGVDLVCDRRRWMGGDGGS